jgi:hypothetical protein
MSLTLKIFDLGNRLEFMNTLINYFGLDIIEMNYVNFDEILQKKISNSLLTYSLKE